MSSRTRRIAADVVIYLLIVVALLWAGSRRGQLTAAAAVPPAARAAQTPLNAADARRQLLDQLQIAVQPAAAPADLTQLTIYNFPAREVARLHVSGTLLTTAGAQPLGRLAFDPQRPQLTLPRPAAGYAQLLLLDLTWFNTHRQLALRLDHLPQLGRPQPAAGGADAGGADAGAGVRTAGVDLQVNKSLSSGQPNIGTTIEYRIDLFHAGSEVAHNVVMTDDLSAILPPDAPYNVAYGYAYIDLHNTGYTEYTFYATRVDNKLVWEIGDLAPGGWGYIIVELQIPTTIADGADLTNVFRVAADEPDVNPADNSSTLTLTASVAVPYVSIAKYGNGTAVAGDYLVYSIDWYVSEGVAFDVVISDTLPAGLTLVDVSGYGPNWSALDTIINGNTLRWEFGNVASGSGGAIELTTQIDFDFTGVLTNSAHISTANPATIVDYGTTVVTTVTQGAPNLTIDKQHDYGSFTPGGSVRYSLYFGNGGNGASANVVISDTLPAGLTLVGAHGYAYLPNYTPLDPIIDGNTLRLTLDTLPSYSYGYIFLDVQIADDLPPGSTIDNTATIIGETPEADQSDNRSTHSATLALASADLGIFKDVDSGSGVAGSLLTYHLSTYNYSVDSAANTVVTDTLPAGLSVVDAWGYGPDYNLLTPTIDGQRVVWPIGQHGYGNAWLYVSVRIDDDVAPGTQLVNHAEVRSTTPDDDGENNVATHRLTVLAPVINFRLDKQQQSGGGGYPGGQTNQPLAPGDDALWRITYTNLGNVPQNVQFTDTLPDGVSLVGVDLFGNTNFDVATSGNSVTVTSQLPIAADGTGFGWFNIIGRVDQDVAPGARLTNVITLTAASGDIFTATHTLRIKGPRLTVDSSALDFSRVYIGYPQTHDLVVRNAEHLTLRIRSIASDSPLVTAALPAGGLALGAGRSAVIPITVSGNTPGPFSANLVISSNSYDSPTFTLPLDGALLSPPLLTVRPGSVQQTLRQAAVATQTLTIANNGGSPLNYTLAAAELPPATRAGADVLLVQDNAPWNEAPYIEQLLAAHNIAYDKIGSAQLAATSLDDYTLLIWPAGQPYSACVQINAAAAQIAAFVAAGGVLFANPLLGFYPCDAYWPGNVYVNSSYESMLAVTLPDHPLAHGVPTPYNDPNYDIIVGGVFYNLPADAQRVMRAGAANGQPTLVEYAYGDGVVVLSGLIHERFAADNGPTFGVLQNAIPYLYDLTGPLRWLRLGQTAGSVPPGSVARIPLTLSAGELVSGTYRANIALGSNDPATPLVNVPVTLTVNVYTTPVALDDVYGGPDALPLAVGAAAGVLANDGAPPPTALTATLHTPPALGDLLLRPDGSFIYTPTLPYSGTQTFSYQLGSARNAPTATVTLAIFTPAAADRWMMAEPQVGGTLVNLSGTLSVTLPADAIALPTLLLLEPHAGPSLAAPSGFLFMGQHFTLSAWRDGARLDDFSFDAPVRFRLHYSVGDGQTIDAQSDMRLFLRNGGAWVDAATTCTPTSVYQHDAAAHTLAVDVCHLTEFALAVEDEATAVRWGPAGVAPLAGVPLAGVLLAGVLLAVGLAAALRRRANRVNG